MPSTDALWKTLSNHSGSHPDYTESPGWFKYAWCQATPADWEWLPYRIEEQLLTKCQFFCPNGGREEDKRGVQSWKGGLEQVETLLLWADPLQGSSQHLAVLLALPFHLCCQGQSLFTPRDLYTSRFQIETKAKILIGVMTMANVIFYEMFGKTQKGIVVYDMKFKRWLHPFVCRFA